MPDAVMVWVFWGDVGFPIFFGVVSYRIRILMYRDVSCGVS